MDRTGVAREYYRTLDERDYDSLSDLLVPDFTQSRPDRTFESRGRFVEFMREERPNADTSHRVDGVFEAGEGGTEAVAVQGRLLDADGNEITGFVDVFGFEDERVRRIETYTD